MNQKPSVAREDGCPDGESDIDETLAGWRKLIILVTELSCLKKGGKLRKLIGKLRCD
jgi:hypothetical protein